MHAMTDIQTWELLSYVVTVFGLPMAILVFVWEQRRDRQQEEEEIHQQLSDDYTGFMKLVLDNADLRMLQRDGAQKQLDVEQLERRLALFNILVALFERAYLLVYEPEMSTKTARLWQSWEDYMREWCRRPDFRAELPAMLQGEDADFAQHIAEIAEQEDGRVTAR
jgi:hypothetical protein